MKPFCTHHRLKWTLMTLAARLCMAPVVQNTLLCAVSYTIFITETRPFLNAVAFQQPCKSKSFRDPTRGGFLWSRMNWLILHYPLQKAFLCNTNRLTAGWNVCPIHRLSFCCESLFSSKKLCPLSPGDQPPTISLSNKHKHNNKKFTVIKKNVKCHSICNFWHFQTSEYFAPQSHSSAPVILHFLERKSKLRACSRQD